AQEDERRRIARDLHDNVCQRMALLAMRLEDLQRGLSPASEESGAVAAMHEDIQVIARDLHSVSHQLHSAALEALGLVDAVASHCREVSDHGVQVQFSHTAVPTVPSDVALCVFRVVQEALANVVKHSRTTTARVTMLGAADTILLRVEDGGCGFVATHAAEGL